MCVCTGTMCEWRAEDSFYHMSLWDQTRDVRLARKCHCPLGHLTSPSVSKCIPVCPLLCAYLLLSVWVPRVPQPTWAFMCIRLVSRHQKQKDALTARCMGTLGTHRKEGANYLRGWRGRNLETLQGKGSF